MASMDFYGFTFKGTHSSDLHILRVSNSNRYNEQLLPAFQDKTVSVPGGDGTYFFESFYTNKTFTINIAFDSLSEEDFRRLRQLFSTKNMGELIFDEAPYKAYLAKIQNPPQLNYICFDVEEVVENAESLIWHNHDLGSNLNRTLSSDSSPTITRVYKGEGTIQFICYYPYARSVHKFLDQYDDTNITNKNEWQAASGMLATQDSYDRTGESINLYNCGDVEADFKAYYPIVSEQIGQKTVYVCKLQRIDLRVSGQDINTMTFNSITRINNLDQYICINSKTNLIEGCDANKNLTGSVYNRFLAEGDFFKIPVTTFSGDPAAPVAMTFISTGCNCNSIEYNYLYY